jgi:glutamine synthetase
MAAAMMTRSAFATKSVVAQKESAFCGIAVAAAPRTIRQTNISFSVNAIAQKAEYIWLDGQEGLSNKGLQFNEVRSKTKVIQDPIPVGGNFPTWSFDGSSTDQASGNDSDCILVPVFSCPDPIRGGNNVLVLCDIEDSNGNPVPSNTRRPLVDIIDAAVEAEEPLYGFEQEYTMLGPDGRVFGWPEGGYPAPQGPFYCGNGLNSAYGRPLAEAHMDACVKAGLMISGINAEVMPGQWEFQIGPAGPLQMGDHVMIARYLLHRLGEDFGISCTFDPKPVLGDWNGTGAHTNFSTKTMRQPGGMKAIDEAIEKLSKTHEEHITQYGTGNEKRLTGLHETCDINTFKSGVADRGSSIRIPRPVQQAGYGYLEDRRPAANTDPYVVARLLIKTILK